MLKNKVLSLLGVCALLALSGCCCRRKSSCESSYDYRDSGVDVREDAYENHSGKRQGVFEIDGEYYVDYDKSQHGECYRPYDPEEDREAAKPARKARRTSRKAVKHELEAADMPEMA